MNLVKLTRSHCNPKMLFNVFALSTLVFHVACHECYICGGEDGQYSCTEFNASYKEVCPQGVASCSLHINGNEVIARMCGEATNLTDCKVANKIKYCYCAANLCNGDTNLGFESDDEDLTEHGSGYDTTTTTTIVEPSTVTPRSNNSNSLKATLYLFLYCLIFI
nr:uncharacterized protein LOC111425361 [Onthophagus taurus]